MTTTVRVCACGCGTLYASGNRAQRYAHTTHRPPKRSTHTGSAYKQARAAVMAHPPNGRPCPRCGQPMTNEQWATGRLDAGHTVDLALGGPIGPDRQEHSSCGRSAGASMGNRKRLGLGVVRLSRQW